MCILFTFLNLTTFQNFKVKPVNLTLLYCAKMLRLTVHLILLISFYFALFDGIEAFEAGAVEGSSSSSPSKRAVASTELQEQEEEPNMLTILRTWWTFLTNSFLLLEEWVGNDVMHFNTDNVGWEPLERPNSTQGWQKVYLQSTYFFKSFFLVSD